MQPADASVNAIRVLNQPRPVVVEADDNGLPRVLVQGRDRLRVLGIQDVWRIDDEWWREPISRRYFQIVLDNGVIRTLYHDLLGGEWFEQWY
jgi:hypothetical protein